MKTHLKYMISQVTNCNDDKCPALPKVQYTFLVTIFYDRKIIFLLVPFIERQIYQ